MNFVICMLLFIVVLFQDSNDVLCFDVRCIASAKIAITCYDAITLHTNWSELGYKMAKYREIWRADLQKLSYQHVIRCF